MLGGDEPRRGDSLNLVQSNLTVVRFAISPVARTAARVGDGDDSHAIRQDFVVDQVGKTVEAVEPEARITPAYPDGVVSLDSR
jgi:hypothetical protein